MVELVRSCRTSNELSQEFGCHTTSILGWERQAGSSGVTTLPTNVAALNAQERQELIELRRTLRQVQIKARHPVKDYGLVCQQKREYDLAPSTNPLRQIRPNSKSNPGLQTCRANNLKRPWEPRKYASLKQQNSMLATLQSWLTENNTRDDAWSYKVHRRIFNEYSGAKTEYIVGPLKAGAASLGRP